MAKNSGGSKNAFLSGFMIIIIVAGLFGVAKVNNIHSPTDIYNYFKSFSDKAWDCGAGEAEWNCNNKNKDNNNNNNDTSKKQVSDPSLGNKNQNIEKLNSLKVADAEKVSYKRSEWKHWIGYPCNTREIVLKEQGKNVKTDNKTCRVLSGEWVDPYSGQIFTDQKKLDIDHIIPLNYVASHGGQSWSADKKQQYANDSKDVLVAVSASENRSKSADGPADYMPPNKDYTCEYSIRWVNIADKYGISITSKDKEALNKGLSTCR